MRRPPYWMADLSRLCQRCTGGHLRTSTSKFSSKSSRLESWCRSRGVDFLSKTWVGPVTAYKWHRMYMVRWHQGNSSCILCLVFINTMCLVCSDGVWAAVSSDEALRGQTDHLVHRSVRRGVACPLCHVSTCRLQIKLGKYLDLLAQVFLPPSYASDQSFDRQIVLYFGYGHET
jgi:hypothetical protein